MRYILFITVLALLTGCNQKTDEVLPEKTSEVLPEKTNEVITVKKLGEVCEDILTTLDANQTPLMLELHEIKADKEQLDAVYREVAGAKLMEVIEGKGNYYNKFKCVEMMKSIFIED
jgi:predicted component of type VI protein secretion system